MKVQELYYCRHGETVALAAGVRSPFDTELTETGKAQMRRTGELLLARGVKPSLIVRSELPRAKQSARIVADILGYNRRRIQVQPLLNERECGKAVGLRHEVIDRRWPGGYDTVPGAETLQELQRRAARAVAWLRSLDAKTVLVVAHGTIGRAIVREFEGRPHTDEFVKGRLNFGRGQAMRLYPLPTTPLM